MEYSVRGVSHTSPQNVIRDCNNALKMHKESLKFQNRCCGLASGALSNMGCGIPGLWDFQSCSRQNLFYDPTRWKVQVKRRNWDFAEKLRAIRLQAIAEYKVLTYFGELVRGRKKTSFTNNFFSHRNFKAKGLENIREYGIHLIRIDCKNLCRYITISTLPICGDTFS